MKYAVLLFALLATPLFSQQAAPLFDPAKGEIGARHPDISNDGSVVVFSLWGDIWRHEGGRCTQLTYHEAYDSFPKLSPNGRFIAFSSDRNGNLDVFVIPSDGGTARQITWHSAGDFVAGFSADGNWVYFTSTRGRNHSLWRVPFGGGTEEQVLDDRFTPGDFSLRDGTLAYTTGAVQRYRRGYQGSASENICILRKGESTPAQATDYQGNDRNPQLLADGRLLFTREISRSFQFMLVVAEDETPVQLSNFSDIGAEEISLSPGGEWLVWQRMHYLYRARVADVLDGGHGELLRLVINQDDRGPQLERRTFTSGFTNPHLSDNGKVLAFELRGAIWVADPQGGNARRVTDPGKGDSRPRVSPDGTRIAFQSTRAGNSDLWLVNVAGGVPVQFTRHAADDFYHNWHPDGLSIVFCSERSGNRDIWLKRLDGSPAVQLTTDPTSDDDPSFSPDGRFIAFDSHRNGTADIFIMDADGRNQRFVTGGPDVEQSPVFSRDGRLLYFERITSGVREPSLYVTTPDGSSVMLLAGGANSVSESLDGSTVIFGQGQAIRYLPAPRQVLDAREIPVIATDTVDLALERVALFDEAWEKVNTRFYTDDFHGADWAAIRQQYRPLVERSRTIEECYYYIWMAIGQLSASHMNVSGRSSGSGRAMTAELGAVLVPVPRLDRRPLRVTRLEKGGPLDAAWVREGDVILAVNGRMLRPGDNAYALMDIWKAGYNFRLTVSPDGTPENAREVTVRAETTAAAAGRRYVTEIAARHEAVRAGTEGKVLYIHLTAMNDDNLQRFRRLLATPQAREAKGLIIDSRNNSGGLSYIEIMELLTARPYLHIKPRTRERWTQPRLYWDKPVTVLCNEFSNSGGECFPWAIQQTGRGKVVGERCPGNVIGTYWDRLADGSTFGVPTEGYFSMDDSRNLENNGVMPDIRVPLTPRDRVHGLDPQLAEAIRVILSEISE